MLLCTRSHFLFVFKISLSLPLSTSWFQVCPTLISSSGLKIGREVLEQHQNCDWRFQLFRQNSLAVVADIEPDYDSAAPKRTLQVNMDADLKLPAAKRYSADRPDCDN